MTHKVMTTVGVVIVIAVGLVLSACQASPGYWGGYDDEVQNGSLCACIVPGLPTAGSDEPAGA